MNLVKRLAQAAVMAAIVLPGLASAVTFNFYQISNNGNQLVGGQLSVDVSAVGATQVAFNVQNIGSIASTIAQVAFDDTGLLANFASLTGSTGVDFKADNKNFPEGSTLNPAFVVDFGYVAKPPPAVNGVDPGESLKITFDLAGGKDVNDVVAALNAGQMRIGLHVISIGDKGSESFVNSPVPLPAAAWLFGSALLGIMGVGYRRRQAGPTA